jgi:hypothetical protein
VNPFNNRWLALFVVVGFLLVVAELVGTGEHGGVLSQAAKSYSAGDETGGVVAEAPPPEVVSEPPVVIEEVPEEDLPQLVTEDEVDDTADFAAVDDLPESEMPTDAPAEEFSSDE